MSPSRPHVSPFYRSPRPPPLAAQRIYVCLMYAGAAESRDTARCIRTRLRSRGLSFVDNQRGVNFVYNLASRAGWKYRGRYGRDVTRDRLRSGISMQRRR